MSRYLLGTAMAVALITTSTPAVAQSKLNALKEQMRQMQERIQQLESSKTTINHNTTHNHAPVQNDSDPQISAVIKGQYGHFSNKNSNIAGFGLGEEAGRSDEGFALGEAEVSIDGDVNDLFYGRLTAALAFHDGEAEVELEEAYFQTLKMPYGTSLKAGRFLAPIGYLNTTHTDEDAFVDRPLPNRAFLNNSYKDNGVEASVKLPTENKTEIGAFVVQGNDFPVGGHETSDPGAYGAFARVGGDITSQQQWETSLSYMRSKPQDRMANHDNVTFDGDSDLYAASLRYNWNPTGNEHDQQVSLQAEYFLRHDNGFAEDIDANTGAVSYDDNQSGWYLQSVYKFAPEWRVGARYSQLITGNAPTGLKGSELDSKGHNPWNTAIMADWTPNDTSQIRLQYGYEELSKDETDNQILLQYIMRLGHHAH